MKCYGYLLGNQKSLHELRELSLLAKPETLRALAQFIEKCADEIENDASWEHAHFSDFIKLTDDPVDIIVCSDNLV